MTVRKAFGIGAFLFAAIGFVNAASAEQTCGCVLPKASAGAQVGQVRAVTGTVMTSLPSGYGAAKPGTALHAGSSVFVGPKSKAALSFGTACDIEASENSTIQVQPTESEICVAVLDSTASTTLASVSVADRPFILQLLGGRNGTIPPSYVPFSLFMGAALGATALSTYQAVYDDQDPVSR
jgi:hypothetical protein